MEDSSQDRNLPATARKIQKARSEGQIARSRDLAHLAVLGCGTGALALLASDILQRLRALMQWHLHFDASALADPASMGSRAAAVIESGLQAYLPLGVGVSLAGVLATIAAGGWIVTLTPMMPDFNRINPREGLKRMFSMQQVAETAKLLAMMTAMSLLAWYFLAARIEAQAAMLLQSLPSALASLGSMVLTGASLLTGVVLIVAAIDVPLQSHLHRARLKMSHQEVKQEHKESDGNQQVKGRRRALAREMSQRSSVNAVQGADLVVMNPTHYAVALRYDEKTMRAPRVVGKGADLVAMRMRDKAKACSVPVLQAPMLARALYANAEVNQEVPSALYTAVAQVLAYVYQLKAAMRGQGATPPAFQAPVVPAELDPHNAAGTGSQA